MTVTLPKELEEFVRLKTASGEYPNANAVVADALRVLQSEMAGDEMPASIRANADGSCPAALKQLLVDAIKGPHHPMKPEYFDQLRLLLRSPRG